jgi:hypothetical protein
VVLIKPSPGTTTRNIRGAISLCAKTLLVNEDGDLSVAFIYIRVSF